MCECVYTYICKYTHELLDNLLDELAERVGRMLDPEVMDELGYDFRVGFTLEAVAPVLQQDLYVFVVRDDAYEQITASHCHKMTCIREREREL